MIKIAAAAAVIAVVGWVAVTRSPQPPNQPLRTELTPSAGDMLTVGYLNAACRRGGWSEVEGRCEEAAGKLDLRPERISVETLIKELQGT